MSEKGIYNCPPDELPPIEGGILLPLEWPNKTTDFKPSAWIHESMDTLVVVTEDIHYRADELIGSHLELYRHPHNNGIVGLSIFGYKTLTKDKPTTSVLRIIARAFTKDWKRRKYIIHRSAQELVWSYVVVFWHVIHNPRAQKVRASI